MPDFPPAPPRRTRRLWLLLPMTLLLAVCAAWSSFWFYAAGRANAAVDGWLEEERTLGHEWTCPGRSLTGFPFRFEFACDSVGYAAQADGVTAKARTFRAVALAYQPDRVVAELDAPLDLNLADSGRQVRLEWSTFRLSVGGLLGKLPHADAVMAKPVVTSQVPDRPGASARSESFQLHLRRNPDLPPGERALDAALSLSQLANGQIDDATASTVPADFTAQGTLTQAHAGTDLTLPEWLEIWRRADGRFDLTGMSLSKGELKVGGTGQVSLDDNHRMRGQLTLDAAGMEPVLARFGIPAAALNVGGLLSGLLGGKGKAGDAPKNSVHLGLKLEKGGVFLGPLKLPVTLAPVY